MRIAVVLLFLANVILELAALAFLPANVAIHFGPDGSPDGWGPSYVNALVMVGINVMVFLMTWLSPQLMRPSASKWVNLPNKDYWLRPDVVEETKKRLTRFMCGFGAALFAFLFVVSALSILANLSTPVRLNLRVFIPAFVAFMVFTMGWLVAMFRDFRVPKSAQTPAR